MSRTTKYKDAMSGGGHMTVREICEKAGIPAEEAKFVSSGLTREVAIGKAEKGEARECAVTKRSSITFRIREAAEVPPKPVREKKAKKAETPAPQPDPEPAPEPDPAESTAPTPKKGKQPSVASMLRGEPQPRRRKAKTA